MTDREKLRNFAQTIIKQKKIQRSVKYVLRISFILLSLGAAAALPLRYFYSISYTVPTILLLFTMAMSFIYGFLGIETELDILIETDEKMHLNEKLSAAFQFGETENPYSGLIMEDALQLSESIKAGDVFPVHFNRKDPFILLLTGIFFFLWMSSFSFLQISDEQMALGNLLIDASAKIDAVKGDENDKDIDDLADEYNKLGQKIQDRFMNQSSLDREIDELSRKLEQKIEDLSREGVNKESKTLSDKDAESDIYQLERKREMSEELGDILESLMKTFSMTPDTRLADSRSGRNGEPSDGEGTSMPEERPNMDDLTKEEPSDESSESGDTVYSEESKPEAGSGNDSEDELKEGESQGNKPGKNEGLEREESQLEANQPESPFFNKEDESDFDSSTEPGNEMTDQSEEFTPFKEEKESGEFGDDDNIRGELREGEQMKSFIRALPHIVEPTREEMDVIHFYRNQLETAVDNERLPEGYEAVIRDYFLAIGVLKNE